MPCLLIIGYFGFGNAGDEAILASMLSLLRSREPELTCYVATGNAEETSQRFQVQGVHWRDTAGLLQAASIADLIILGGGGLFHDYWGFDPDLVLSDQHWGMSYFASAAVLALLTDKPLALYAVGVGPLLSEHGRRFTRLIADTASYISVRDPGSADLLQTIGVPRERIVVTPDPAFHIPQPVNPPVPVPAHERPLVGVSLRKWQFGVDQSFWEREIARALDGFAAHHDVDFLFLPFSMSDSEVESDTYELKRVRQLMQKKDRVILPDAPLSFSDLRHWIEQCSFVLGMRLHSLIFAAANGVPFLGLVYDPKLQGCFAQSPAAEDLISLDAIDAGSLLRLMLEGYAKRSEKSQALRAFVAEQADLCRRVPEALAELRNQPGSQAALHIPDVLRRVMRSYLDRSVNAEQAKVLSQRTAELERMLNEQTALAGQLRNQQAQFEMQYGLISDELESAAERQQVALQELAQANASLDQWKRQALANTQKLEEQQQEAVRLEKLLAAEQRHRQRDRAAYEAVSGELSLAKEKALKADKTLQELRQQFRRMLETEKQRAIEAERQRAIIPANKTLKAVAKQQIHVALDLGQVVIPEFLRAGVRSWYLNGFYYRVFPEHRPATQQRQVAAPVENDSLDWVSVHSRYQPMIELKASLQKALPLNYSIDSGQSEPLVSVILPVYNGERYIADSVRSVLAQTYRNLELIIINDGSTDRTLEVLEEFRNDQRLKIHTQPNRKLPAALSAGFAKAKGEFYTWTSADNLMKPRCLEVLVKFLASRSDVEMVYANEEIIDDQGRAVEESDFCPGYQVPPGSANIHWPEDPGELIFVQNNYIGACFLYRSWAGRILGDYDDHCFGYEDYEYWMRMDALFRVAHLGRPDTLYLYRLHEESLSAKEKQMKIVERVRSFMSIEGERHQLYADLCDITLIGSHPWFSSFEGLYRSAGHNVFAWKDHTPSNSYHFQITRSSEKAVAIIAVDELLRQRSLATFLKEVRAAQPDCLLVGIVDHVATLRDNLFPGAELDWVLSGTPAVVSDLQAQGMRNYLEVRAAEAVAYPLMCVVNNAFGLRLAHARLEQNDQPVLETTLRATT